MTPHERNSYTFNKESFMNTRSGKSDHQCPLMQERSEATKYNKMHQSGVSKLITFKIYSG